MRLSTTALTSGPATSSALACPRSAMRPNPSCDSDAAPWYTIISVPAACRLIPSRGIRSGSSGAYMLEYASTMKCADDTTPRGRPSTGTGVT